MVLSYITILIGWLWSHGKNNDPLNGVIVMFIGVFVLYKVIQNNFYKTPKIFAITGSLMQIVFYIPVTLLIIPIIAMLMAFFSQTKPVYVINGND